MHEGRWWIARITVELGTETQDTLPEWAIGACGWMVAFAVDEEMAAERLRDTVLNAGLRVTEIEDMAEVFSYEEVNEFDEALASNFRNAVADARAVWGTLFAYAGDGEA